MAHLIVTDFNTAARDFLTLPLGKRLNDPLVVPVRASHPLVEVGVVSAPGKGTILPCINWVRIFAIRTSLSVAHLELGYIAVSKDLDTHRNL